MHNKWVRVAQLKCLSFVLFNCWVFTGFIFTMRVDVLTVAITIFVLGLLVSSLGLSEVFDTPDKPPAPHQRGFVVAQE